VVRGWITALGSKSSCSTPSEERAFPRKHTDVKTRMSALVA
jgi:hypothetical protein